MGNESEPKPPRQSIIRKRIQRTLQTAPYETLVIEDGIEEIIEWTSLSERQKKVSNWDTLLIQGFKQSSDRIIKELGLTHKKAYFKNPSEETKERYKEQAESEKRSVADLDDLDTLGDK